MVSPDPHTSVDVLEDLHICRSALLGKADKYASALLHLCRSRSALADAVKVRKPKQHADVSTTTWRAATAISLLAIDHSEPYKPARTKRGDASSSLVGVASFFPPQLFPEDRSPSESPWLGVPIRECRRSGQRHLHVAFPLHDEQRIFLLPLETARCHYSGMDPAMPSQCPALPSMDGNNAATPSAADLDVEDVT